MNVLEGALLEIAGHTTLDRTSDINLCFRSTSDVDRLTIHRWQVLVQLGQIGDRKREPTLPHLGDGYLPSQLTAAEILASL